ncbi:von Willebrand factor type C domain [Popillia japonica]|uniref:von Willebrand factor type C domain n=1 Tax=Popillia japonica TaxID=7064 RepID=A0AAW1JWZ8_POPJA
MFVKIGETVSDQDIQEWIKGKNEDGTFLTEKEIIEVISDTEHEAVGNQESNEEVPSVNLIPQINTSTSANQYFDLCELLDLRNNTRNGVSYVEGPNLGKPAYRLGDTERNLRLPDVWLKKISSFLENTYEFTISAWIQQDKQNVGTLVSFTRGDNRYLELQSSGRKNEIRFHYTSELDSKVYVETFHYKLADNAWHHVAVSVSGWETELFVDCKSLYRRILKPGAPARNFSVTQLWLGQRYRQFPFKGAMQDVRLIPGPLGYLSSCPKLDSSCPTCGQFSLLQDTVQELTRHLKELSERLVAAEGRINKVEECDCQKSCFFNGTVHADGATWQRDCDLCTCVHGEVECRPVECPVLNCKNPVKKESECCQTCLRACLLMGTFYDHGDMVNMKQCMQCHCHDGSMQCTKVDPNIICPQLPCPPEDQFSVQGECCKFCPDIDECLEEGGSNGHHCHLNTKCVNTNGSYKCECLPGYKRVDRFNCAELDECSTGEHKCDVNANCINTQGSYHCVCKDGYSGNGYSCKPVCNQTCLNGGTCIKPGKCLCRSGYTGRSCEKDLDECATNLHRCSESSVCVNMVGWYYCKCKPGYESPVENNKLGNLCQDVDECEMGTHTCHPSAQCSNTNGGFMCLCPPGRGSAHLPSVGSMFEHQRRFHVSVSAGSRFRLQIQFNCTCNFGVVTCEKPTCDCSVPGNSQNICCPQCNPQLGCRHQELRNVILMHGEHWSYDCQHCECENGEIDCWDMQCPPLACANPIKGETDCCPHCDDFDLCSFGNTTYTGQPCHHEGIQYNADDPCVACKCKDGVFCCSFIDPCDDNEHTLGHNDRAVASTQQQQLQLQQQKPTPAYVRQFHRSAGSKTTNSDVTRQNSATVRVPNSDPEVVYNGDSTGDNKTDEGTNG